MEDIISFIDTCSKAENNGQDNPGEVQRYLGEMLANINPSVVRALVRPLGKVLNRLWDGLHVRCAEGVDPRDLVDRYNVVFVPNHQSHADYVLFNYVLLKEFGISPFTAGGINLNIFPVGSLFRSLGCVFIRRSFQENPVYKRTLKYYLHYLMTEKKHPLEFYYEGGRSRNGMLQSPRFGFFSMIMDNHRKASAGQIPHNGKPLVFIPVSIVHEHLPEQGSLARETGGQDKNPEHPLHLFNVVKILNKSFGKTHIRFGRPVEVSGHHASLRSGVQSVAFSCYREVANGIPVTAVGLGSLILLDGPAGGLPMKAILDRAKTIISYCQKFEIPLTLSSDFSEWSLQLGEAIRFLTKKAMVRKELHPALKRVLFVVRQEQRVALSYFKNTILHHFFLPALLFLVWERIRTGETKTVQDIQEFILDKRKELKYDIYIPSVESMWARGPRLLEHFSGSNGKEMEAIFRLSKKDFNTLGEATSFYGSFFRYKYEAYYVAALTLLNLADREFSRAEFFRISLEIFRIEKLNGIVIRHPESYSRPVMKNTLNYCLNQGILEASADGFRVTDQEKIKSMIIRYSQNIVDIYQINLRLSLEESSIS